MKGQHGWFWRQGSIPCPAIAKLSRRELDSAAPGYELIIVDRTHKKDASGWDETVELFACGAGASGVPSCTRPFLRRHASGSTSGRIETSTEIRYRVNFEGTDLLVGPDVEPGEVEGTIVRDRYRLEFH
jgi:hypothetical protein